MMYCSRTVLSRFLPALSIASSALILSACGSSSSSSPTQSLEQGLVEVVFPLSSVATAGDTFKVRGSMTDNVSNIELNGIPVDTSTYASEGYWLANMPIEYGDNHFSVSYESNGETFDVDGHKISRRSVFSDRIKAIAQHPNDGTYYAIVSDTNALVKYSADGREADIVHQFYVEHSPNGDDDNDEPLEQEPEALWFSADGTHLYFYTDFNGDHFNSDYISTFDLSNNALSILYGPDSPGYIDIDQSSDFMPLVALNRGSDGVVYFFPEDGRNDVYSFDIASTTMSVLDIATLENATGGTRADYYGLGLKDDNTAVIIGQQTNPSSEIFTTELDLSACDGAMGACTLGFADTTITPLADAACPDISHHNTQSFYHAPSHSFVSATKSIICSLDIAANTFTDRTSKFSEFLVVNDNAYEYSFTNNELWFSLDSSLDSRAARYVLQDDYASSTQYPDIFGSSYVIGNALIQPQTPREVITDEANQRIFWIDRNNGGPVNAEVHEWKADTDTWRIVGNYPEHSFEQGAFDPINETLYILNETSNTGNVVYQIDPDTGDANVIIGAAELAIAPNFPDLNVRALALDAVNQHLYLANAVYGASVPVGFSPFSLIRWDITNGGWTEIAAIEADPDGSSLVPQYHLEFDAQRERLYFKRQGEDELWSVDIATGDRAIFSPDDAAFGPGLSNNRGAVIDPNNNRLLGTSQDHESLFATDLDTGIRTMISPDATGYGIGFDSSKGIDLFEQTQVAFVADEDIDALYQVDLVTGQRAIMQNQEKK